MQNQLKIPIRKNLTQKSHQAYLLATLQTRPNSTTFLFEAGDKSHYVQLSLKLKWAKHVSKRPHFSKPQVAFFTFKNPPAITTEQILTDSLLMRRR